jgi:hypothetical protein
VPGGVSSLLLQTDKEIIQSEYSDTDETQCEDSADDETRLVAGLFVVIGAANRENADQDQ